MTTLRNHFSRPHDSQKHRDTLKWIEDKISKGTLDFHTCLGMIQDAVDKEDLEQVEINVYYTVNIIIGSKHFKNDQERIDIISGLQKEVQNLRDKLGS